MSAYYTAPPRVNPFYPFLWKHKLAQHMEALVVWADQEYLYAVKQSVKYGHPRTIKILADEWSGFRVLSQMDGFRKLCAALHADPDQWNMLKPRTRKFIRKAYEIYELLRD